VIFADDRRFRVETPWILGHAVYGGSDAHGHAGAERLAMVRVFGRLDTTLGQAGGSRHDHITSAQHEEIS